ncbi:DNA translocase FtsK [Alphaproteobacteria bacterium]|nr:DNA translocase FtsK [Alphaproteobacteria bacterium]MDB3974138.1 DNA translocase FtsK [Alphaproteobacteria bacterium]
MSKYIPEILKDKFQSFTKYFYVCFYGLVVICLGLSLLSFNINDNSFLTSSSEPTLNILGPIGSYIASFLFYTFGLMAYGIMIFFFTFALKIFFNQRLNLLFLRLLFFFISLILIPLSFLEVAIEFKLYEGIYSWGFFTHEMFKLHQIPYLNYCMSFAGVILFLYTQNILYFKVPRVRLSKIFQHKEVELKKKTQKKEPVILNRSINITNASEDNDEVEYSSSALNTKQKEVNNFSKPSLDILDSNETVKNNKKKLENIEQSSELLEKVFADFNIEIKVMNVKLGPVVTLFEILPAAGTKINTIINLAGDISRSMGVGAVRIAQIYGTQYLGVEVPNSQRETVTIKELLSDRNFKDTTHKIPICIGKDISGNIEVIDLSKTPHLLVAGTTGSGKSVFINTLLTSILYKFSPEDLRLILIDPKMLELSVYNDIAHLLTPVVTEPKKAIIALKWVCKEMERRYSLMNEENTRSLEGYNQKSLEKLPFIIVFIDEMADLMMTAGKEVEHYVQRLAQMARACGIHLVMATQRPSVDIITGSIKANFPSRISFQVASKYDSRTVLGEIGAEQLLGNGDMLMSKNGASLVRYQSAFISDNEVNKLIKEIKNSQEVNYLEELEEIIKNNDESFDTLSDEDEALISKSIDLIKSTNKASTSFLQRNFQIGYNKAARIMEALEQRGVVSSPNHTGKRDILINK